MKNKVIALILIIPIVLMFCVFSAANIATLSVPIAVNSVSLFHEWNEKVNLAENDEFQINAQVMPRNASNKGLIYTYEKVSGKPVLEIDEEGLVKASGYGTAKITVTTKDGSYKKSFMLEVTSTVATMLETQLNISTDIVVGDNFKILATVLPNQALDKNVKFASSNENIVRVNRLTGECTAISSGRVTLTATLENGIDGKIEKQIEVVVLPTINSNPITFNGLTNLTDKIFENNFTAVMEVNFSSLHALGETLTKEDITLSFNQAQVENVEIINFATDNNGIYKYYLNISGIKTADFELSANLNYENYKQYVSKINLEKIDLSAIQVNLNNWNNYVKLNALNTFSIDILPTDFTGYQTFVSFENKTVTLNENEGDYYMVCRSAGINTLKVEIAYDGEIIKTFQQQFTVLNPPSSIQFQESLYENYGIEELVTIASHKIENNEYVLNDYKFGLPSDVDLNYVNFSCSDENIATFENGKLKILGEGKIIITAEELQSKLLNQPLEIVSVQVRCVNGVEVGSYSELVKATEDNKQVVLTNDIELGEKLVEVNNDGSTKLLKSASECSQILKSEVKQIETSGEWNYYKNNPNLNYQTPPLINYIIKFTNNCFGNGHILNANNITNIVDGTNNPYSFAVFKGPLDLVAIPDASVKAQDNICFIATDNVMLNNVQLVGANLNGTDTADLNSLNYVGTVLEVMGDNVKIVNSRIRNGRNCVRVYGKESGNFDKINVHIESCVISYAREFLIKMGTNAKLYGQFTKRDSINLADGITDQNIWEECSPKIENFMHLNSESLSESEYNALVESYNQNEQFLALIKTNLTLKNCLLHTSGLISIGVESSFAGPALDGGRYNSWKFTEYGWRQIAGTSYPVMLNLEGIVKLYDWKNISHIDSSTLIEGDLFNFDLSEMIEELYSSGEFTDIITIDNNQKYAHGGIVTYGGGKNYALINDNTLMGELDNYVLSLDSINSILTSILKYASGKEPFRIFMYGKNSYYNYYKQDAELGSNAGQESLAEADLGKYVY